MDVKSEFDGYLLKLVMRQNTEIAAIQEQLRHQKELIRVLEARQSEFEARQSEFEANLKDFGERSQLFLTNSWKELNERLGLLDEFAQWLGTLLPERKVGGD